VAEDQIGLAAFGEALGVERACRFKVDLRMRVKQTEIFEQCFDNPRVD